ncbi:MAG TPA: serine/threonine-protein kinase [Candidatus Sulfomarinibacteraceae bacterium]|nr:serine/threonine-protein kinase [Candidatus Sulfomarinibacteraceae bacterium]
MRTERWDEVRELFLRVADLDPAAREAHLDEACGEDRDLRHEVESLLGQNDRSDTFLPRLIEHAAQDLVGDPASDPAARPARIGPYRVIELLGRGGMGSVYLAEREGGPFQQQVALKVLRTGLNDTDMAARFKSERQILADLRHPNIAGLVDGGTTEDGVPFLAMEYVQGRRIDRWCDQDQKSIEQRIDLFRVVCSAVQAAHRSLVVHRDLKPANILVTTDGHVKLLDFGIAKILGPSSHSHTVVVTRTIDRLLTPAFASPEQVSGDAVTTASDVYSLGVILYELLAGTNPHAFKDHSATEIERVVCRTDPERPSQAVRRRIGTAKGAEAARLRGLSEDRLARRLAGDLDTIVMTALRKEPDRRYSSVEALSEDLRRHAAGLPVMARPDTLTYRASKFVRRHRTAVAATSAAMIAVLAFGVQSSVNAREAVRERDRALAAEERARIEAETADRVSAFLIDLFRVADPSESRGEEVSVRALLDRGAGRIDDELAGEPEIQARLLEAVGEVYSNLGEYATAGELLERSVDLLRENDPASPELPEALNGYAKVRFDLGDRDAAEALSQEALSVARQTFDGDHQQTALALNNLGWIAYEKGAYEEAERVLSEALEMRRRVWGDEHGEVAETLFNLGTVALELNRVDEAVARMEQAHDMRRRILGPDHPVTLGGIGNVVAALEAQKQYSRGLQRLAETIPTAIGIFGPEHPDIAYLEVMRGRQLRFLGRTDEARKAFDEALRIERHVRGPDHPYVGYAQIQIGTLCAGAGELDAAEAAYLEALRIYRRAYPEGDRNVANTLGKLSELALQRGRGDEALRLARESRKLFGRLLPEGHSELLECDVLVGLAMAAAGQTAEAVPFLEGLLPKLVAEAGEDGEIVRRVREALKSI